MSTQSTYVARWIGSRLSSYRFTAVLPGKHSGFGDGGEFSLTNTQRVLWCLGLLCAFASWRVGTAGMRVEDFTGGNKSVSETAATNEAVERPYFGHRLEPREPVVLQGSGPVNEEGFAAFGNALGPNRPLLTATYVDLNEDLPLFFASLRGDLARTEQADVDKGLLIPQIGLSLGTALESDRPARQVHLQVEDKQLSELVAGLRSLDRPVFLRIGYASNDAANGYEPQSYIATYRRIAEVIRFAGLQQVALVWDWSPDAELDVEEGGARERDAEARWQAFYPGDDVVDWWGLSLLSEPGMMSPATTQFLASAERRRFPVMIGQATPRGHEASEGSLVTESWYRPYFHLIHASPAIKAACYFNRDWRVYPQWSSWGDARIEADPTVLSFNRSEMSSPLYAGVRSRRQTLALLGAD